MTPRRTNTYRDVRRRGMAMPIVLLLLLVSGLTLTVVLQRQDAASKSTARRLQAYQRFHEQRGFQEIVELWLFSHAQNGIADKLDDDGHAFDLELADRGQIRVRLEPAQGAIRRDPEGLTRTAQNRAQGMLDELAEVLGGESAFLGTDEQDRPYTRASGPVAIDAMTAPRACVVAAASYALRSTRRASAFADALEDARLDDEVTENELDDAGDAVDADQTERVLLDRVFTVEPRLWWCEIEMLGTDLGRPNAVTARFGGHLLVSGPGGGGGGGRGSDNEETRPEGRGSFLSWQALDLPQ
ncbi:MAG: hypothetical protein AAF138_02840 [Planctomycetota bacterium]